MPNYSPEASAQIADRMYRTEIDGLLYLEHQRKEDDRGFYKEISILPDLNEHLETPFEVKQLNQARSLPNVIRGIHAEQWNKLVTVTNGICFCAIVDLQPDSVKFGHVVTFLLGTEAPALNGSLYIPAGLGNSLCVVNGPIDYLYAVDQLYRDRDPAYDRAISLFDPELNIPWPIDRNQMIVSERDQHAISLAELKSQLSVVANS